jgi:general secretion pathway protein G
MDHPNRRNIVQTSRRGFTIIEVLIVIGLILGLATIVFINLRGSKKEGQVNTAKIKMNMLERALDRFHDKFERYPTDAEGLKVLWDKSVLESTDEAEAAKWEAFIDKPENAEKDPWNTAWGYMQKDESLEEDLFLLWSWGPDKADGTDDDIPLRAKRDADAGGSMGDTSSK